MRDYLLFAAFQAIVSLHIMELRTLLGMWLDEMLKQVHTPLLAF